MKKYGYFLAAFVFLAAMLTACGQEKAEEVTEKSKEVRQITLWHYFNDSQSEMLNTLIKEYNQTEGAKKQVEIVAVGQGGVNDLAAKISVILNDSTNQVDSPNLVYSYRDTIMEIIARHPDALADYSDYFTKEELEQYQENYLAEGRFEDKQYIVPMAKSTELLFMNQVEFDRFLAANPDYSAADLKTWESLAGISEAYYKWTDSLTPETPGDGKAFFGMDNFANYFIAQNNAFGSSIYEEDKNGNIAYDLNEEYITRMFLEVYIPYTKGWYLGTESRRSDDLRQMKLACYVGSLSSTLYFPETTYDEEGNGEDITLGVYSYPHFDGEDKVAIQQGAGIAMVDKTEEENKLCVEFLKWLSFDKGMVYASMLSYMPAVEKNWDAEDLSYVENENVRKGIEAGMEQSRDYRTVWGLSFPGALDIRMNLDTYFASCIESGRKEYLEYEAQGMTEEEIEQYMDYEKRGKEFYQNVTAIFQ